MSRLVAALGCGVRLIFQIAENPSTTRRFEAKPLWNYRPSECLIDLGRPAKRLASAPGTRSAFRAAPARSDVQPKRPNEGRALAGESLDITVAAARLSFDYAISTAGPVLGTPSVISSMAARLRALFQCRNAPL